MNLMQKKPLNPSRITRVARGAGVTVKQVNDMIEEFKRLKTVVEKMGKVKLGKGNDMANLARNPAQMMSKLGKVVDPKMLQQMGGMGNLMNMMKEVGKMEGLGDMMKMFKK